MQFVSDRFLTAVKESGNRITVADLYYNRQKVPVVTDLPVISGQLTIDSTAAQRRSGTVTLASSDLISLDATKTLEPYGLEIGIRCGVQYPDGDLEFVNMGIYVITDITWSEANGGLPTVTLADRSRWIQEQSSITGVEDYSGQSTFTAIQDLLTKSVFINVEQSTTKVDPFQLPPDTLRLVVDEEHLTDITIPGASPMDGGSFWDDCSTLAASLGAEIFFDADGTNVMLQEIPDITSDDLLADAVVVVDVGVNGTLVDSAKTLSRTDAWNAVQYTGVLADNTDSTGAPPTVFVYDNNPASVTFYDITGGTNSGFGRIVKTASSDTITSKTDLYKAATALLKQGLGLTEALTVDMLPNPALDAGDKILVKHVDGTQDLVMITQITFDLGSAAVMELTCVSPNQISAVLGGTGIGDGSGGGGAIPAPPGSTIKNYNATWSKSYNASNATSVGGSSKYAYQGDDGKDTNRKSLIGFDYATIQADLLGKTIVSCSLTIKYIHWWYNAGTAVVGTHNLTVSSGPSTYDPTAVTANRVQSGGWARNSRKSLNLGASIGLDFQSGQATGIALGPGPSSSKNYYAYAAGFGYTTTTAPVLTIVYTS